MNIRIEIKLIGGIWFVNDKRIGYDLLTIAENNALNDFFIEYKLNQKLK